MADCPSSLGSMGPVAVLPRCIRFRVEPTLGGENARFPDHQAGEFLCFDSCPKNENAVFPGDFMIVERIITALHRRGKNNISRVVGDHRRKAMKV
ncbi:hypothetical protein JRQ81_006066 [Phrynocephalus forsythii]|uniref:Uncharacterized protein n=1 Tax=Phrynocephalus forsythii TaxID=171643 RepID=A0A9Q1AW07_9SAUR|nr:hypothetical protein JRQ81_006066 [Phrynocephalus forsythii]